MGPDPGRCQKTDDKKWDLVAGAVQESLWMQYFKNRRLQSQLLSDILSGRKKKIDSVEEGIVKIKEVVRSKRVLIVLDDVDKPEQLEAVVGMHDWLCPGSKVIVTTVRERLLTNDEYFQEHRVKGLDNHESLEFFSWYAFGQNHPIDGYLVDSKRAIEYCNGLPAAIAVLGSALCRTSRAVWQSLPQKLKFIPDHDILEKLKAVVGMQKLKFIPDHDILK